MQQTKITFLGGLDTIGGNIICIQHGKFRILTDFGAQVGTSMEEQLDARHTGYLVEAGKLPKVQGIYPAENLYDCEFVESFEESDMETLICLSHLHIDHIGSLKHVSQEIPVFCLADAKPLYDLLTQTNLLPDYDINLQGMEPDEALEFGPFTIHFHESDHDALGSAAIFIECPDLKIVYSGDLRLTGFHPNRVLSWAQKARNWQADLLLIEGTSFSFGLVEPTPEQAAIDALTSPWNLTTEAQAIQAFHDLFKQETETCVAFNGYPQNVERTVKYIEAAHLAGRIIALRLDLQELVQPFLTSDIETIILTEETLTDIKQSPHHYALMVSPEDVSWLNVASEGIYLHSNGHPLGHYMPDYAEYVQTIVKAGWTFVQAGVSGHAYKEDLLTLAYLVDAQVTVPWHTYNRQGYLQALQERGIRTWDPVLHETYDAQTIQNLGR